MATTESTRMISWRSTLDVVATVSVIVLCGTLVWATVAGRPSAPVQAQRPTAPIKRPEPPLPTEPVSLEGALLQGSPSAKVAVLEYSDFQCPYCGTFARETLPELERLYVASGRVRIAFRQLPLEQIHSFAFKAAESAKCAGLQGKFWPMHDLLFANQKALEDVDLRARAATLGLDHVRFDGCLNGLVAMGIREDMATAKALGVTGTPTFFLGVFQTDGRVKLIQRLGGAPSLARFRAALDQALLAAAKPPTK